MRLRPNVPKTTLLRREGFWLEIETRESQFDIKRRQKKLLKEKQNQKNQRYPIRIYITINNHNEDKQKPKDSTLSYNDLQ